MRPKKPWTFTTNSCIVVTMQTRRDYLVSLGLAKPGRGKFSTIAKAALDKARSEGIKFSDDDAPAPRQSTPKADAPATPVPVDPRNTHFLFPDEYRFPEAEYKGTDPTGHEVSLRECCNLCRVSLVNHGCDAPTIHGNIVVRIVRRREANVA